MATSFDITMFQHLTESEVLSIRTNARASITSGTAGQTITSVTTRDLSTTFAVDTTPQQVLSACTWQLQRLNPDVYGTDMIRKKVKFVR